jgi:hypothetical protein
MGRAAEIEPRWLVSLLKRWVIFNELDTVGALGYSSGSNWMRGLKSSPATAIDSPTGFCSLDFRDLEAGIGYMQEHATDLLATLLMYHKPWTISSYRADGHPFANSTYFDRLHRAHRVLADEMDSMRAKRKGRIAELQIVAK